MDESREIEDYEREISELTSEIDRLKKDKRSMASSIVSMMGIQDQLIANLPEGDFRTVQEAMQEGARGILLGVLERDPDVGDLASELR